MRGLTKRSTNLIPRWPFTVNRQSDQARGLVAWWPMLWGGNVVPNLANQGAPLTLNSSLQYVQGLYGTAIKGDGAAGCAQASPNLENLTTLTVSGWLYHYALPGSYNMVWEYSVDFGVNTRSVAFFRDSGAGNIQVAAQGTAGAYSTALYPDFALGGWHHWAVCYDYTATSNCVNLYLDGVFQTPSSRPLNSNISGTSLGAYTWNVLARNGGGSLPCDSSIADHRLYNYILSASEVWALYDPATRYELYQPVHSRLYFAPIAGANTRVSDFNIAIGAV